MKENRNLLTPVKNALQQIVGFPKLLASFQARRWRTSFFILGEAIILGVLLSYFLGSADLASLAALAVTIFVFLVIAHAIAEKRLYDRLSLAPGDDLGNQTKVTAANNNWRPADRLQNIAINDVIVGTLALRESEAIRLEVRYAGRTYWLRLKKLFGYFLGSWIIGLVLVPLAAFWVTVGYTVSEPTVLAEYIKSFIHTLGTNQPAAERFMVEMAVITISYWKLVVGLVTSLLYINTMKIYDEEFARRIRIKTGCSSTGVIEITPVEG